MSVQLIYFYGVKFCLAKSYAAKAQKLRQLITNTSRILFYRRILFQNPDPATVITSQQKRSFTFHASVEPNNLRKGHVNERATQQDPPFVRCNAWRPSNIDAKGWRDIALRVEREAIKDNLGLVAAGVVYNEEDSRGFIRYQSNGRLC